MRDNILKYINKNPYCSFGDLCSIYDGKKKDLQSLVNTLIDEGDIIDDKGYVLPSNLGLIKATIVSVKERFAFANIYDSDDDVHIDASDMENALLGDIVYLQYDVNRFYVCKIVKRRYKDVVGEVVLEGKFKTVKVNSIACNNITFLLPNDTNCKNEDIVSVKIESYQDLKINVSLNSVLGQKNAPFMDVTRLILENDAPIEFPSEVDEEVLTIPQKVSKEDKEGRLDLTNEFIVTIDGDDSKDFDDAISIELLPNDSYKLGVHIADVSHYVKPDSPLDKEALNRGTSIYVTDRVVPMLPFALSNGICSLNEGVERLTISCIMTVDKKGYVTHSEIVPSVIKSTHRLTYNFVNNVIAENNPKNLLENKILMFNECAKHIHALREKRGSLELSVPEIKIKVDEKGYPIDIVKKIQGPGEKLIEDFMVLANEVVASTIEKRGLPMIYRIHEDPVAKRLATFATFSGRLGIKAAFDPLNVTPKELQTHLDKINEGERKEVISATLLRCLAKARYSSDNKGHFGLASKSYTHFTSPIRRYPDLIVHRIIRRFLFEEDYSNLDELRLHLDFLAENTSMKERRAITIERDCNDMKGAEFMTSHIGEKYTGYIDGLTNNGIYVELENGLSGCIRFEDMNDYYVVNESSYQAIGKRSHHIYSVGDKVMVQVMKTDKQKGTITLALVSAKEEHGKRKYIDSRTKRKLSHKKGYKRF